MSYQILVIEDNELDLVILEKYINDIDVTTAKVLHAFTINTAKEILQSHIVDIIILDLNLPDSSGLKTFSTINALATNIPIIILSGVNDIAMALKAINLGAQDYLIKGEYDRVAIYKSIRYSIERKKSQEALLESNLRFEYASKATAEIIWDWDLQQNKIYRSEANFIKIFGKELLPRKNDVHFLKSFLQEEEVKHLYKIIDEAFTNPQQQSFSYKYRIQLNNQTIHINDRAYIIRNKQGVAIRVIGAMEDITENIMLQNELINATLDRQRSVTNEVIESTEKEKLEISKELHDNIGQLLTVAVFQLHNANKVTDSLVKEFVENSKKTIHDAIVQIRKLSNSLASTVVFDIGIVEAIKQMIQIFNLSKVADISFEYNNNFEGMNNTLMITVYRIIDEQLTNVIKHAHATKANVVLNLKNNTLFLTITDNGHGAKDATNIKGGLKDIFNRVLLYNGKAEIITEPQQGFSLQVQLPYQKN
jgi:two-component system sensor histidine kinase UhpB